MPTVIEEEKQKAMLDTFREGIHALGLSDKKNIGAAKGDIKLTSGGPMIGEIAARLSGGYMSGWTYPYSSGALPIKAAILIAMGNKPEGLIPLKKWTCAERAFISIPGTVKQITINKEQRAKNSEQFGDYVNDVFMRIKEGNNVSFPENNVTKCGNVIASAPDREAAIAAAESAARSILVRLDPADPQTKEFLGKFSHGDTEGTKAQREEREKNASFPPDAFQLTDDLKVALNLLPEYHENFTTNQHKPTRTDEKISKNKFVSVREGSWSIYPFKAFTSSNLTDYMGRTVEEALEAVSLLTGVSVSSVPPCETISNSFENAENKVILGRSFWAALIRGSYQGAVYFIESLGAK
jgi:hypothetical protein